MCTAFGRSEALVTSDHAPVYASYNLHMPPLSKLGEALYQAPAQGASGLGAGVRGRDWGLAVRASG